MSTSLMAMPTTEERTWMKELAGISIKSGLLPKAVNTPEKAIIIQMYARANAIDPMVAFSEIYVVNGKPSMSVKLKMSLIAKKIQGAYVQPIKSSATSCTAVGYRPGREPMEYTYTIEQARQAGLAGKDIWRNYPDKMLMWRACGVIADMMFPDISTMGTAHPDDNEPAIEIEKKEPKKIEAPKPKLKPKHTPMDTVKNILEKNTKPAFHPDNAPKKEEEQKVEPPKLDITKPPSFADRINSDKENFFKKGQTNG